VVSTFATSPSTCVLWLVAKVLTTKTGVLGQVAKVLTTKVKNEGSSSASEDTPRRFTPFRSATSLSLTSRVTRYRLVAKVLTTMLVNLVKDPSCMIHQFIHLVRCPNSIVVIAQEWPCWLSAIIALKLPLMVAFITKEFQSMFNVPQYAPLLMFADMWEAPEEWNSCTVLASGSNEYLGFVRSKLKHHEGPFIYSTKPIVKNRCRRDIISLLDTWARLRKEQGL
jgi:hypothetical protein